MEGGLCGTLGSSIRLGWVGSGGSGSASMESSVPVMDVSAVAAESVLVLIVLSDVVLLPMTTTLGGVVL